MSRRRFDHRRAGLVGAALCLIGVVAFWMRAPEPVPVSFPNDECRAAYTRFYQNPEIDLRVVFGYKDARPARFVADRYESLNLIQRLLSACRPEDAACGFSRVPAQSGAFTRTIVGPDGLPRKIRLRIVQPSVGADDQENRENPFQAWRSEYAKDAFLSGLRDADAVFYNGHSRAGGGPDFAPPLLRGGNGVDFARYQRERPGFKEVLSVLGQETQAGSRSDSGLKLVGFFSCASSQHFVAQANEAAPNLGVISSPELLYFSDALESLTAALSGLLTMRCEPDFTRQMNAARIAQSAKTRASSAQVSGFFKK